MSVLSDLKARYTQPVEPFRTERRIELVLLVLVLIGLLQLTACLTTRLLESRWLGGEEGLLGMPTAPILVPSVRYLLQQ